MTSNSNFAVLALLVVIAIGGVEPHGNMLIPLNRASIWRNPKFASYNPRENWNDRELYCGGFIKQYYNNGGNCGPCGDDWAERAPRHHENTGYFGQGIITANYTAGQEIPIQIYLEAYHMGYFEFSICQLANRGSIETNECFSLTLEQSNGSGQKFIVDKGIGIYDMTYRLPEGFRCDACVLRWHYETGNLWGDCDDGTQGFGCGPQEIFRNCADISIY
ncbi:uncharacterized protein LOC110858845 [Folsomia candida]|uniref:Chitin-binding type-4 domain-containing protein n=1 Tax=Folsomia candida TaxID=158441 RepID=A0A226DEC1_FOLCA|nr:uncharacterized protein LOC110858845 [Folsomia candida]OXA43523.1 hypothetical protein Fcan01_21831 [Folsomia candida]